MKSLYIAKRVLFANIPMMVVIMVMALAFTLIFGKLMVGGSVEPTYSIAVVMEDAGALAADFQQGITDNSRFQVVTVPEDEARRLVRERSIVLAVWVKEDFTEDLRSGQSPELTFLREEQNNLYMAARQEIERELTRIRVAVVTANRVTAGGIQSQWDAVYADALVAWERPPVTVETRNLGEKLDNGRQMDRTGIGMTVMFVMITVISASGAILDERGRGTWQRIIAAPADRRTVLSGYLLSYFGLGLLQFSILLTVSRFIMGISWGNLFGVAAVTVMFLLCSISLGLLIAGVVRTFQQQQAISTLVVTATSMLGGLFWPIDIVSPVMQTIAKATPQYWAMQGYEQLLFRGLDWSMLQQPLLILLGFTLVFFSVGVSRIKFS